MQLGSRQLGSFQLGGGPTAPPTPVGPGLWVETDMQIVTPGESDVALATLAGSDMAIQPHETDASILPNETDAVLYL